MLEIKYRIVDDFKTLKMIAADEFDNEWNQITGFFEICFNEHNEGTYYHDYTPTNEEGGELLDYWIDKLLQVIILLGSKSEYVAIKEIETVNRWLEFKKQGENVVINVAVYDRCQISSLILIENVFFSYIEPIDFVIPYKRLEQQVTDIATKFLEELSNMNHHLCGTKLFLELSKKITLAKGNITALPLGGTL